MLWLKRVELWLQRALMRRRLASTWTSDRSAAVRDLESLAYREGAKEWAVSLLEECLTDSERSVRQCAFVSLVKVARHETDRQRELWLLERALKDPAYQIRNDAVFALKHLHITNLTQLHQICSLLHTMINDSNYYVCTNALKFLRDMVPTIQQLDGVRGVEAHREILDFLDPVLKVLRESSEASTKGAAAEALVAIGDPRAIGSLVPLLRDRDGETRAHAASALVELGWEPEDLPQRLLLDWANRKAVLLPTDNVTRAQVIAQALQIEPKDPSALGWLDELAVQMPRDGLREVIEKLPPTLRFRLLAILGMVFEPTHVDIRVNSSMYIRHILFLPACNAILITFRTRDNSPAVAGMWDVSTGAQVASLPTQIATAERIAVSPDSRSLAVSSGDRVMLFNLESRLFDRTFPADEHKSEVTALAFSPDGQRLAVGAKGPGIRLFFIDSDETPSCVLTPGPAGWMSQPVSEIAFSSIGKLAAATGESRTWYRGELLLWEALPTDTHTELWSGQVNSLGFSRDDDLVGAMLTEGGYAGWKLVGVWYVDTKQNVILQCNQNERFYVAGLPKERYQLTHPFAVVRLDGGLFILDEQGIYDRDAGETYQIAWGSLVNTGAKVKRFAISPDKRTMAVVSDEAGGESVRIWDCRELAHHNILLLEC